MRLYELVIEDENTDEVFQISLVENPAIEAFGVFFNKDEVHFAQMEEEGLFMAPILIPDKKILRVDGEGLPYEVYFTSETIKRLAQMYLERKYQSNVNVEHKDKVNGVTLVESWIKESQNADKSKLYNLNVPVGSWIGTFKIDNEELREKFRKGELRAVSIEGLFEHMERTTPERMQSAMVAEMWNKHINELSEVEAEVVLSKVRALIKKDNRYKIGKKIELESYSDYGDGVKNNAKRGIELNESNGNKCATQTGKVRAQQLANGEPISIETIKRMHSYLSRAETYYDNAESQNECGYISYLLWGGKAALGWSRNKLRELGLLQENEAQPSIVSTYPGEAAESGSFISPALLAEAPEMDIFGYETSHFYICPGAVGTFNHLVNEMNITDDDLVDMIRAAAVIADTVFMIEARVIESGKAEERDLRRATTLVDMFKDVFQTINERTGMEHDISYMDGHIEVIKSYL
jgi:hypothetical protein